MLLYIEGLIMVDDFGESSKEELRNELSKILGGWFEYQASMGDGVDGSLERFTIEEE